MIQKEVRKYLKCLGFYEARQVGSPDSSPKIALYVERKSSKSRSGSKGRKSTIERNEISERYSRKTSPDEINNQNNFQETTVIVELTGIKNHELFGNLNGESDASDSQSVMVVEPIRNPEPILQSFINQKSSNQSLQKSNQQQTISNSSSHHERPRSSKLSSDKINRNNAKPLRQKSRQQSSSSEREKSLKRTKDRKTA